MVPKTLFLLFIFSFSVIAYSTVPVTVAEQEQNKKITSEIARSGNPILSGWYADPEAHVFENQYWIYPTYSAPYDEQVFLDAFSSKDLVKWQKHSHVLDVSDVHWAKRAIWAPSIVEKDGWYYLFFGANDIQNDQQVGGIGVARARRPEGPFKDYLGRPLIDKFHNGAQPIDQMVFKDNDGSYYIVYGGWRHCNIAKLNADFTDLIPFPDGTIFKEITPNGYVEGAFMLVKDGKYYFMWSEGGWTGPNYAVAYAVGTSPFGPFERVGKILQQDPAVATGAGHHSVLHAPGSDKWYIVYHRRPLGETDRNHRVVCIDEMHFDDRGFILPVKISKEGVPRDILRGEEIRSKKNEPSDEF
ncbi:MAG TPA: glycoside hydrolase family 43 protein [Blastocatellia bacterium]|nr:glycoside hydrolase family 43 protein [Blastocatellia bacterium]